MSWKLGSKPRASLNTLSQLLIPSAGSSHGRFTTLEAPEINGTPGRLTSKMVITELFCENHSLISLCSKCDHFPGTYICFRSSISRGQQVIARLYVTHWWIVQDPEVNRLEDSLLLWKSVVSNKLLAHVSIILFLNKVDLLQVCCYYLGMQGGDTDAYFRQSSKAVSDSATICRAMVTDQMITKMYLHVGCNSPCH